MPLQDVEEGVDETHNESRCNECLAYIPQITRACFSHDNEQVWLALSAQDTKIAIKVTLPPPAHRDGATGWIGNVQ